MENYKKDVILITIYSIVMSFILSVLARLSIHYGYMNTKVAVTGIPSFFLNVLGVFLIILGIIITIVIIVLLIFDVEVIKDCFFRKKGWKNNLDTILKKR